MLLAIDFETYFDSDCTLKKLNYIQYLNHPKFEVLGAAVLADDRHEFLTHDELVDFLDDLDPSETDVLAYNTLFDGCILAWRYGFKPRKWLDALSMARGALALPSHSLDAVAQYFGLPSKKAATFKGKTWSELTFEEQRELSDYARHDVWLCHEIYDKLMPYPQDELDLIDLTIRMFVEPRLELDLPLANELLLEQRTHKETLREASGLTSTQLSSNKQLAELIKERYQLDPPTKISPTTGKETWAFSKNDPEFEAFHASAPPELKSLLDARIAIKSTIEETRLETLIETQEFVGKIPVPLIYYGGHTGRWSGSLFNLQNLPKKSRIRNTLIAPEDHVLLIADSASIEARVLAWFAEQKDLLEIFHNKGDPYRQMASIIYGIPIDEVTKPLRNVGKQAILGCIAAGELVLTREKGRIPIEQMTTEHTVWDGVTWVHHDGVVYQGIKEVIYHDGLWATPDHKVYLENNESDQITLQKAKDANEPLWSISNMHLLHDVPTPRQSPVYDILNAGPRHRFTVSDRLVSNCGYGMGASKFHATANKQGVKLSDEEAERIIQIYRSTNNKIKNLWYFLNDKISTIAKGPTTNGFFVTHNDYKCVTFEKNAIRLPNRLALKYPNLRVNDKGEWIYGDNRKLYGGAMCLAGDTLVLTNRGPIPLLEITNTDKVFDGVSWVTHGGVVYKGLKQTIDFGTIRMTPDHKVWTETGWRPAGDISFDAARQAFLSQSEKPIRAALRNLVGNCLRRLKQEKNTMGSALYRLWYNENFRLLTPPTSEILWLYSREQRNPPNDDYTTICRLPQHDSPLQKPEAPSLEKLRRTWNLCSRKLELFQKFLDRYGTYLSTGPSVRPNKQRRKLLERELSLGNLPRERKQPKKHQIHNNPNGHHAISPSGQKIQHRSINPPLPTKCKSTRQPTAITARCAEPVYDLLDCGPHHRFTVMNRAGDKILVHNCENIIQALARIVIGEQALRAHREVAPVVLLVHDEIVCVTPKRGAEAKLEHLLEIMRTPPAWAPGLPLDAEGEVSASYKK